MRMPGYPSGVPSQYTVHYHPWPTRFHGPLYQRPVFGYPWMATPQNVFKPGDFYPVGDAATPTTMTLGLNQPLAVYLIVGAIIGSVATHLVMRYR